MNPEAVEAACLLYLLGFLPAGLRVGDEHEQST